MRSPSPRLRDRDGCPASPRGGEAGTPPSPACGDVRERGRKRRDASRDDAAAGRAARAEPQSKISHEHVRPSA